MNIRQIYFKLRLIIISKLWNMNLIGNKLTPPHEIKQKTILFFRNKNKIRTLVETGTYMGSMIERQLSNFDLIYSIEIDDALYKRAKDKFKNEPKVNIMHGDSSLSIQELLHQLNQTVIFWLDGHYSGPNTGSGVLKCPVIKELHSIFEHHIKNHIILIDDARLFNGLDDYPNLSEIENLISQNLKNYNTYVRNDIIICEPNNGEK